MACAATFSCKQPWPLPLTTFANAALSTGLARATVAATAKTSAAALAGAFPLPALPCRPPPVISSTPGLRIRL